MFTSNFEGCYFTLIMDFILEWCFRVGSIYSQWWLLLRQAGDCRPRSTLPWPESCCLSAPPCPPARKKSLRFSGVSWAYTSHRVVPHCVQPNILSVVFFVCFFPINVWNWTEISFQISSWISPWLFSTLEEAESSFLEAEQVVEELHQRGGITQDEKTKSELEISTGLSRCSVVKQTIVIFLDF